ncbi:SDR family NAD(P)-dependent oxidoreductase [Lentzea sp. NEAU-D7]|uniref:SDR family NAD(P)-dependent oxidoreductase n=1 Tax=Lentzea sp. NEAU-D7 TaxID=2994667 RepID=UPI00224AF1A6|nr:SDR family NAD(P)-dependent oxidoreductase [Lentzea sp. NEAU-D7]MCX2947311.1 SDR family NAD(P)-dependent oxidoreductase [Lentzea sp. NEAU-D7]
MRRPAELREWAAAHDDRVLVLKLGVTDAEQVRAAVRAAEERFGGIVTMSLLAGLVGVQGFGYYSAAKFALEGLSEALRQEVEPFGVRVLGGAAYDAAVAVHEDALVELRAHEKLSRGADF